VAVVLNKATEETKTTFQKKKENCKMDNKHLLEAKQEEKFIRKRCTTRNEDISHNIKGR